MSGEVFGKLFENRITRPLKRSAVRAMAANPRSRVALNKWYRSLTDEGKSRFHARYAKIFRDRTVDFGDGDWIVEFAGHQIKLPLRSTFGWLDWDNAVSLLGHDVEIKQTYAALIASTQRPKIFIDVGANYGTHSILFLSAGIPTISFEPNPSCFETFQAISAINGFKGQWKQVAIGNKSGTIELAYPEKETWLGSISSEVISELKKIGDVKIQHTQIGRLDDILEAVSPADVLIKIDVEGSELDVLLGSSNLLARCKPKIIFESRNADSRPELFDLLTKSGFSIYPLPWRPLGRWTHLDRNSLKDNQAHNFIAVANI